MPLITIICVHALESTVGGLEKEPNKIKKRNKQATSRRYTMKAIVYVLMMAVLLGLSGCVIMPWGPMGGGRHGEGGGPGPAVEQHEVHR